MQYPYGRESHIAMRVAQTESGKVRGVPGNNPAFTVFRGIPYAAPPVGSRRWRMAEPCEPWEGIRDCVEFGKISYQFMFRDGLYPESEDCLYLNIYTPAASPEEKLPVLFFIPGGAFMGGYSNRPQYAGEGFCQRGVLLVPLNYRTGPLGMLSHREMESENPYGVIGNIYYLDQIYALKWVRRNIASFGGDPDRITIMGHSSGAVAVTALAVSPLTRGDIAGCIIQSGPVTEDLMDPDGSAHSSPFWISREEAVRRGDEYMAACGCKSLEEMRSLSCEQLDAAYRKMDRWLCHFRGVIDGYTFPEDPVVMYREGKHHDVPYMIGLAGDEGTGLMNILTPDNLERYAEGFGSQKEDFIAFCQQLTPSELAGGLVDVNAFRCRLFAETQLKNGMQPAYCYCTIRRAPGDSAGAYHGIEHPYVFQTLDRDWRDYSGSDYDLSKQMCQYWANFVRTGDPNGEGLTHWTPYTAVCKETMMFDVSPWMGERKLSKIQQYKLDYFLGK